EQDHDSDSEYGCAACGTGEEETFDDWLARGASESSAAAVDSTELALGQGADGEGSDFDSGNEGEGEPYSSSAATPSSYGIVTGPRGERTMLVPPQPRSSDLPVPRSGLADTEAAFEAGRANESEEDTQLRAAAADSVALVGQPAGVRADACGGRSDSGTPLADSVATATEPDGEPEGRFDGGPGGGVDGGIDGGSAGRISVDMVGGFARGLEDGFVGGYRNGALSCAEGCDCDDCRKRFADELDMPDLLAESSDDDDEPGGRPRPMRFTSSVRTALRHADDVAVVCPATEVCGNGTAAEETEKDFIIDSGCTASCTGEPRNPLTNFVQRRESISLGNASHRVQSYGRGSLGPLDNVMYAPEMSFSMVSVSALDQLGCFAVFGGGRCVITVPGEGGAIAAAVSDVGEDNTMLTGTLLRKLYHVDR
ncbi:hypothetical protein B484DRAFT_440641, partial [Ochromonadaceae sp. CCMP2298]